MDDLWARMVAKYGGDCTTPLAQQPQARLVVLRKRRDGEGANDGGGAAGVDEGERGGARVKVPSAL